jgi:hypothetical protein
MAEHYLGPQQPSPGSIPNGIVIGRAAHEHQTKRFMSYGLSKLDLPTSRWELTEELQKEYKNQILPNINSELQNFFNSDRKGELFTIDACMMGKSQIKAKPTILFIGRDPQTREGAKKAIKDSRILVQFAHWKLDDTEEFPVLSGACDALSVLEDFEFFSSNGQVEWLDEQANLSPTIATEVYLDLRIYTEPHNQQLPRKGLPIYVKHFSCLRLATANIVQLDNRHFIQTVYHAFCSHNYRKESEGSGTSPPDLQRLLPINELALVGRLVVWSVDRDWAVIEILNKTMDFLINHIPAEDNRTPLAFRKAERPHTTEVDAYTWTSASDMRTVVLSITSTYMKLPGSSSFQEVYRARLREGSWSNGDCGAVVTSRNAELTFGHVLGGSKTKGIAFIIAAEHVMNDFRESSFLSRLRIHVSITLRVYIFET